MRPSYGTPDVRIGLISDTHGLLRLQAIEALQGSGAILHAGDIGDPAILDALERIAPLHAVRGNNDTGPWALALPETRLLRLGDVIVYLLHDLIDLAKHPPGERVDVIVAGHSHRPRVDRGPDGVLRVNPGSAGRRRFTLPVSIGRLDIQGREVRASIVELAV